MTSTVSNSLSTTLARIMADVQENQKPARQLHIYGVIQASMALARIHGIDLNKATLAAALHDSAKHMDREEILKLVRDDKISLSETDMDYPAIWHGPVAGWLGRSQYNITDLEVLDAAENHTLGRCNPSPLLQVLMCADSTEPSRDYPGVEELRKTVRNDLRTGLLAVLNAKVSDIVGRGQKPHPRIFETLKSLEA